MRRFVTSMSHAWSGFVFAMRHERNMKIHAVLAALSFLLGAVLRISRVEWLFVLLAVCLVIAMELVNTAIEKAIDAGAAGRHPLVRTAKDCAAAAVLMSAVFAACVGAVIFGGKWFGG